MYAISKNGYAPLKQTALAAILAASLTACGTVSGVQPEAPEVKANAVVVGAAAPTPAAELPDVPDDVKKCLLRSVEADAKRAKNADGALDAAFKSDRTKLSCAQIHLKWYADLKAARSGGKAIDKKDDPKQKRADAKAALPKATWE